jgi:hypothetical protein
VDVKLDPDALAVLEDQQAFLRSSLADLEAEHDAGDMDDTDYATLKADYDRRLSAVTSAIDDGKATFAAVPKRDPRRVALIVAAVVVFAVVCGVVVANMAGRRSGGDTITGDTPSDASRSKLTDCYSAWFNDLDLPKAAVCFDDVLVADATNREAQTYGAGVRIMALEPNDPTFLQAVARLVDVVQQDATYGDPHAFLALAWMKQGLNDSASKELAAVDKLTTSSVATQIAAQVRSDLANSR